MVVDRHAPRKGFLWATLRKGNGRIGGDGGQKYLQIEVACRPATLDEFLRSLEGDFRQAMRKAGAEIANSGTGPDGEEQRPGFHIDYTAGDVTGQVVARVVQDEPDPDDPVLRDYRITLLVDESPR
jgi:hypothetical protein